MDRRMAGGWLIEESDSGRDRPIGRYTQMEPARQTDRGRQAIHRPCSATNTHQNCSFPPASTAVTNFTDCSERELRPVTSRPIPDVYNCVAH